MARIGGRLRAGIITAAAEAHYRLANTESRVPIMPPGPRVLSIETTLARVLEERLSIARFGDGELRLMGRAGIGFQHASDSLGDALAELAYGDSPSLLVCVPDIFGSLDAYSEPSAAIWKRHLLRERARWVRTFGRQDSRAHGNAFISRPYLDWKDKSRAHSRFEMLKQIWRSRDVLVVEGADTRLGVANDLLAGARSVKRIIAPSVDAWLCRDDILAAATQHPGRLILLALGPTATVLAGDLSALGFQALDVGHIDVEYEWYLAGALWKTPIPGKHVNEAGGLPVASLDSDEYRSQVVGQIGV